MEAVREVEKRSGAELTMLSSWRAGPCCVRSVTARLRKFLSS